MSKYRPNVAVVITDGNGGVLLCERVDRRGYVQFVQGGIDQGESCEEAAIREVYEEVGLRPHQFVIRQRLLKRYAYTWTEEIQERLAHTGFIGQEQVFYLFEVDRDTSFDLDVHDREFERVWWGTAQEALEQAWEPKKPGMQAALSAFGLL